jgi:hypothetical protein
MMVFLVCGLHGLGGKSPANKGWKKLKALKLIPNMKLFKDKVRKKKIRYERAFVLQMAPIRQALEQSGVNETVTIEVRQRSKLLERLGTYEPVLKDEDDRQVASYESIPNGFRTFVNLAGINLDPTDPQAKDPDSTFAQGHLLQLWFKNKKGKVKARLKVSFVFINTRFF